jgi:hypothetical protein
MRDMDDDRDRINVVRVRRRAGGVPQLLVILGIIAVVASIVKPWEAPGRASPAGLPSLAPPTRTPGSVTPAAVLGSSSGVVVSPSASLPADDPRAVPCVSRGGWRVVTVQRMAGRESRTWTAVEPATARAPTDPSITFVREVTAVTRALGFCSPASLDVDGRRDPAAIEARVWRLDGNRTKATDLGTLTRLAPPGASSSDLFLAPGADTLGASRWVPGRYVFRVSHRHDGWEWWFGVELVRATGPSDG